MKYFAAIQSIIAPEKIDALQQLHVQYLDRMVSEGRIYIKGKFSDGSGGLTIYRAASIDDARMLAEEDPYVSGGARRLELHEWEMKPRPD
jgi:uncharacterized protein